MAGRLPIIGTFVGPISLAKDIISTFIGSKGDSDAIVAAIREELREALMDPKVTIWNYSSFFNEKLSEVEPHAIFFIIPKRLTSIKVGVEQKFYHKDDRIPIMIKGKKKEKGVFPLFDRDQWEWTLTIDSNPSKTINELIRLPPQAYAAGNTPSLLDFLNRVDGYIEHYNEGRLGEGSELYEQLDNQTSYVLNYYIPDSFGILKEAINSAPELQALPYRRGFAEPCTSGGCYSSF